MIATRPGGGLTSDSDGLFTPPLFHRRHAPLSATRGDYCCGAVQRLRDGVRSTTAGGYPVPRVRQQGTSGQGTRGGPVGLDLARGGGGNLAPNVNVVKCLAHKTSSSARA